MLFLVAALLAVSCTRENGLAIQDDAGVEDLAGADLRGVDLSGKPRDGAGPPPDLGKPPDMAGRMCGSTCSQCLTGPCCSGGCCRAGEYCENGQCHCGNGPACTPTNPICAAGGPVGGNSCGITCCGGTTPCPL
jgi:hypothetical protein